MVIENAYALEEIKLGRRGENQARKVVFNVLEKWREGYGEGVASLIVQRNGDAQPYPVTVTEEDGALVWRVSSVDTAVAGEGAAELRYTVGDIARLVSETKLPCVVKPVANGSSVGVSIAHTGAELIKALEECLQFGAQVVLEQYISGREIQVGIIAGKALPSIEIIPKTGFYDYANKYQAGAAEEICPSPIPEDWEMRVRTATETVYRLIGLSVYSRADFIVTPDGTPYFLEINTLPGMTKTSLLPQEAAAVGIGYEELCEKIVEESLKQKRGL